MSSSSNTYCLKCKQPTADMKPSVAKVAMKGRTEGSVVHRMQKSSSCGTCGRTKKKFVREMGTGVKQSSASSSPSLPKTGKGVSSLPSLVERKRNLASLDKHKVDSFDSANLPIRGEPLYSPAVYGTPKYISFSPSVSSSSSR